MMNRTLETVQSHYTLAETIIIVVVTMIIVLIALLGLQAWVKRLKSKKVKSRNWQMRAFYSLGILALAFVIINFVRGIFLVSTSTGLPSPMTNFVSEQFNISIDHPKNWASSDLPDGNHGDHEAIAFIGFAGPSQTQIIIARKSFDQPTLEDVASWGKSRIGMMASKGFVISFDTLTSSDNSTLIRYYSRSSQGLFGSTTDKCMDWYTIKNTFGYDLEFCTREKYWSQMESIFFQMAQSFQAQ